MFGIEGFHEIGIWRRAGELMMRNSVDVYPEEQEQLRESDAVNGADAEELVDARVAAVGLQVRKPAMGNGKFRITLSLGNFGTPLRDIACGQAETCTDFL